MDKNNDIQVNKVSKWEAAPVSIKNLRNYISESWVNYAAPPCCPPLDPSCQDSICESMITLLESVLDDYNELEAKYQESCGMISQYEEENKKLKSAEDCYEVYRNSYERTVNDACKLQEFLEKCGVPVKYRNDDTWYWDFENSAWDDTLMKDCKLIDKCRELEKENNNLTTDNKRLSNAVEAWFDMFIGMRHKRDDLKKECEKLEEANKSLRRSVRILDEGGWYV